MNIMGIGPQEMMVIAVIGLLVFGPGKLPEVMGQAGKLVRDFRRMSDELSGEFGKTIAEAREMTDGLTAELGGMSKEVNSITNSVKKDLGVKGSSTAKKPAGSKAGTTSKSSTSSRTGASKTGGSKSNSSASKTGSKAGKTGTTSASKTGSSASKTKTTSTVAKKPPVPVASREDPTADVFLFDPAPVERPTRSRKAVPSMIADPTPRSVASESAPDSILQGEDASNPSDDAVSRARQRRRKAGYARAQG